MRRPVGPAGTPAGTPATTGVGAALQALAAANQATPSPAGQATGSWRWLLRQRVVGVREALLVDAPGADAGWLASRGGAAFRERNELLTKLSAMGDRVLADPDPVEVRAAVARLVAEVRHHLQKVADLALQSEATASAEAPEADAG